MQVPPRHGTVRELAPFPRAPQQKAAAAHVAPSHELPGKTEAIAEGLSQNVDVLAGRDAPEENDLAFRAEGGRESARLTGRRPPVSRLRRVDRDPGEAAKPVHG